MRGTILACAWSALLGLSGCLSSTDTLYKESGYAMGSLVEFTIYGVDEARAKAAVAAAQTDLNFLHGNLDPWHPGSLARMNSLFALGGRFTAAASVLPLIAKSTELSQRSGGLFNPAIGKLIHLWGFQNDDPPPSGPPPTAAQIAAVLAQQPRMSDLHSEGVEIESSNPALVLDFGGIAQGYAADVLIEGFKLAGIRNAIVNISGDVRVLGAHGDQPWRIGIRNPRGAGMLASLTMRGDESVVTSGDYERFYIYEGKRYHHILDPRSGQPAQDAASATVISTEATFADAAATALMVAGVKHWHEVAKAMGVKAAMLVDAAGRVYMDPATAQRIHFEVEPPPPVILSAPL